MTEHPAPRIPLAYKAFTAFTTIACVVLCVLLLLAQAANRRLVQSFAEAMEKVGSAGLAVGEQVEPLTIAAVLGGDALPVPSAALTYDDGRTGTLLLLLSGACDTCKFSIPYFARLAALAETRGIVAIGVQLDASSESDLAYDGTGGFPIAAAYNAPKTWLRRVPIVPAIVLLDPRGVVIKTYFGELSPRQQADVESFIERWDATAPQTEKAPSSGP